MKPRALRQACLALMLGGLLAPTAWGAYKVVGPDGRVTYTDRPTPGQAAQPMRKPSAGVSGASLPYELQQVVNRHPVTLYTAQDCPTCDTGRQLLQTRGVPYVEKTVDTPEDIRAFKAQENTGKLPTLRIGGKQLPGLQQSEWNAYLDAAGYPQQSKLPPGHAQPAPSPLADPKPSSEGSGERRPDEERPITPTIGNPPEGFRF